MTSRSPTPSRRGLAQHYRRAAERALDGYGYMYLADHGISYSDILKELDGFTATPLERSLFLCLVADIVAAGDAWQ